jgi:hypothetical protein
MERKQSQGEGGKRLHEHLTYHEKNVIILQKLIPMDLHCFARFELLSCDKEKFWIKLLFRTLEGDLATLVSMERTYSDDKLQFSQYF